METQHQIAKRVEPSPHVLRIFYFICGVVATIAYRIVLWLNPFWVQVAWYAGTIGFIIYFWHRTVVETKRAKLVRENNLVQAVAKSDIPEAQKAMVLYLTETSATSKVRYNSLFICLASVAALIINIGLYLFSR